MLAKQLDDALCSGGAGDWRGRRCASCQAPAARTSAGRANGSEPTESQPMSLLAELEQAEAANVQPTATAAATSSSSSTLNAGAPLPMVDVDLTTDYGPQSELNAERWATRLCDVLERQRRADTTGSRSELSADTRRRLLKLIGTGGGGADGGPEASAGGKPAGAVDLAELVRNRDGRVAELTCEVRIVLSIITPCTR